MNAKQIITIIILLLTTGVLAQEKADIQQIRKWYNETKKEMTFAQEHPREGVLYCDIIEKNVHNASWRAVGEYHIKKQMWYNDQPDFLDNPSAGLSMVVINLERSIRKEYSEYLYHNGELVFVYYKDNLNELRFYFKDNKLIKKIEELGNDEEALTERDVQHNAEIYMNQYLSDTVANMLGE